MDGGTQADGLFQSAGIEPKAGISTRGR